MTKYFCDRCKEEVLAQIDFNRFEVKSDRTDEFPKEWCLCRSCWKGVVNYLIEVAMPEKKD